MANGKQNEIKPSADYTNFLIKLFRRIPNNSALIIENVFSGSRPRVINRPGSGENRGFAFLLPWQKSKLISLAVRNVDYEKQKFDDENGQELNVDLAVSIKITDPIKYMYNHKNPEYDLQQKISELMRIIVNNTNYESLKGSSFHLDRIKDPRKSANIALYDGKYYYKDRFIVKNGSKCYERADYDIALYNLKLTLDKFEKDYGIRVISLVNKEVQQSAEMQKADDQIRKARLEKDVAQINAEKAKIEAEGRAIANKIELQSIYESLKKTGMSEDNIRIVMTSVLYSKANNTDAKTSSSAVAGAVAGATASSTNNFQYNKRK